MSDLESMRGQAPETAGGRSIFPEPAPAASPDLVPRADGPDPIEGRLRKAPLRVPENYEACSGFTLFGRRIRTLLYSTDVAAIRNSNADAIFAVYPFTAQPSITQALLTVAEAPLFVGVGGGTTTGRRATELAAVSEMQGAAGVILNSPATPDMVGQVVATVDIPVIATITRFDDEAAEKVRLGARIINVAAGRRTPEVIAELRAAFPTLPIIATGGRNDEAVARTVAAGANALIWAPPSVAEIQRDMMVRYREQVETATQEPAEAAVAVPVPDASVPVADMPVANVPNGVVTTVPPEVEETEQIGEEDFVSPYRGRLPRLLLSRKNR